MDAIRSAARRGACGALLALVLAAGCIGGGAAGQPDLVWSRRGIAPGHLEKPRAIAIDRRDEIYVVDMTARIQVFDSDGNYLRGWQTPDHSSGRPTGLSVGIDGQILVADTHYHRLLVYSPQGELLRTIGGTPGEAPGQFGLVTDAVQDSEGNYYIGEYGEYDRIQKYTAEGRFLLEWGGHGDEPGQFHRPQNLEVDEQGRIWVADACNHRIQVFDSQGKLLFHWGKPGAKPGELYYPYDLELLHDGAVAVAEYGNHRIQRFTRDGRPLGCWGTHGRLPGQLDTPWGLVEDHSGRIHVLDTKNHRVQRVRM